MAFSRAPSPEATPAPGDADSAHGGHRDELRRGAEADADIESTLVHASALGMDDGDLRVLAVLTTWLGVHHTHVNADRLVRQVGAHPSERVRAYWAAIAAWLRKDRRLARLATRLRGRAGRAAANRDRSSRCNVAARMSASRSRSCSPRRAPSVTAMTTCSRRRPSIRRHAGYRNRVLMGPSFRADVWTTLEHAPGLSIADVARKASCSFATAWQAAQDFRLLRAAEVATTGWPARRGRRHGSVGDG
jgi:hypothetical protein